MDNINTRIKQVIEALGVSQTEFAKKLNISPSMVSKICSGASEPSTRTLSDISDKFGIDEMWLRFGIGEMFHEQSLGERLATFYARIIGGGGEPIQREFAIALLDATPEELKSLKSLAVKLLKAQNVKDPFAEFEEDEKLPQE